MATSVGFIGVGGIAAAHMPNVAGREDTRISAVCDIDRSRAEAAAQKWGATAYTDYREMIDKEDLDAVYVCLWPCAHGTIELDLCERGIPFLTEKPVNLDLAAAVRAARAVGEKKLVTAVGYQVRYAPHVQRAREFLAGRKIALVEGWFVGGLPPPLWWPQKKFSGGQAVEQTTHIYDLARFLAGEVAMVCAFGSTGSMTDIQDYDVEDASVGLLEFESGACGHVTSACVHTDGGLSRTGLKFDGRSFTVDLTYVSLAIHTSEGSREEDHAGALTPAMQRLDHTFLTAAQTGDASQVLSSYEDGVRSVAVSLAVSESMAAGGKPVRPADLLKAAGM